MIELKPDSAGYLSCTFCGKHQRKVRKLVRGVHAVICDQCVDLYNSIIAEGGPSYLVASAHSTATLRDRPMTPDRAAMLCTMP